MPPMTCSAANKNGKKAAVATKEGGEEEEEDDDDEEEEEDADDAADSSGGLRVRLPLYQGCLAMVAFESGCSCGWPAKQHVCMGGAEPSHAHAIIRVSGRELCAEQ